MDYVNARQSTLEQSALELTEELSGIEYKLATLMKLLQKPKTGK